MAYLGLAALLATDLADFRHSGFQVEPMRAHRLVDVSAGIGRARGVNPIIAVAGRGVGGDDAELQLPVGCESLLARKQDSFTGKTVATINGGLISPFLGGRIRRVGYDAVLDSAAAASIESDPRVERLPMDVWALRTADATQTARLYTDPDRMHIYVVPAGHFRGAAR